MINIEKRDKLYIVTFDTDNINALITEEIRTEISRLIETANSGVIIDLGSIKYIDSSGFGIFLAIDRLARNNYSLVKFVNIQPTVMEVLRTLHLNTVFKIYDNLEDCIRSMK